MLTSLIAFVEHTLIPLGAVGVFSASLIEQLLPLIPSSLIMLLSGFLFLSPHEFLSADFFSALVFTIVIPVMIGGTLGSILFYSICYQLGKPAIERFGKYMGVSWEEIEKAENKLRNSPVDEIAFLAMTCMPILPTSIPTVLAGTIRYPLKKYLAILAVGMVVRSVIYGSLGASAGSLYHEHVALINTLEHYLVAVIAAAVLAGFAWWSYRRYRT
ncbi:MAG TPA: VTT domain-containing protein [Candidatus Paceibacterota bacterium]|nr:VTT domain-containing protein [Candidatus Paceibacterota bacterium]